MVDLASQQFEKLPNTTLKPPLFRMKLRNGVLAETDSIEEVLGRENSGSGQIVNLSYEQSTTEQTPSRIAIEFINVDAQDEEGFISIRFHVFGHSRDWVFVTSSLLEERLEKIARFALNQLGGRGSSRLLFYAVASLIPLVIWILLLVSESSSRPSLRLEEAVKSGRVTNAIDAIILVEREKEKAQSQFPFSASGRPLALLGIGFVCFLAVVWFFYKYYPVYNFCWGEYVEEFDKKENARRFWLIVVAIGLLLSFLGSLLANKIHL